jgi:hypothetical protein
MLNLQASPTHQLNELQQQNDILVKRIEELTDTLDQLLKLIPPINNQVTSNKSHTFFNS